MMRLRFILLVFLALLYCLSAYAAQSQVRFRHLTEPSVTWKGDRLTGELKNVPVSGLLEELIKNQRFGCTVQGKLSGVISISFENLTIEQIIHKIMRNNNYNYTMLSKPKSNGVDDYPEIGELTIYQGDSTVRFTRVPLSDRKSPLDNTSPIRLTPSEKASDKQAAAPVEYSGNNIEELDRQIKAFLDDMLDSKNITIEEYKKALVDITVGTKE